MRRKVIGFGRCVARLAVRAGGGEIDLDDSCVAVAPLALDESDTFFARQVDGRLGFTLGEHVLQGRGPRERGGEEQQCR